MAGVEKGGLVVECISARLMEVRIQREGKSNGVSFFVVDYAPTLDCLRKRPFLEYARQRGHRGSQWAPPICPHGCERLDGQTTERVR